MQRRQVGILIFPEVEVLDFCGPYEVFTAARLDEARRREDPSPFQVWVMAEREEAIATDAGMRVLPDCALPACPALDILVVPGGWGTRRQLQNDTLMDWLAERGRQVISSGTLASVCTGALLLGQAGLLDGRRATTHWRSLQLLRESFPRVTVEERLHVVEDGNLITSAGIAAGLDLALKVVARYYGEGVARATARHMEYRYPQDNARRI